VSKLRAKLARIGADDYGFVKDLLDKLWWNADSRWRNHAKLPKDTRMSVNHAAPSRYRMKREEFIAMMSAFPTNQIAITEHVLWLPPLMDDSKFIPMIHGCCDLANYQADLQLELYSFSEDEGPQSISLRFESPNDSPPHNFWHSQLVIQSRYLEPLGGVPEWFPTTLPTFALNASSPVSLLLSMLVALYGGVYVQRLMANIRGRDLRPYYELLNSISPL
jgi:hypothetical protein